jgi:hypothetical protein
VEQAIATLTEDGKPSGANDGAIAAICASMAQDLFERTQARQAETRRWCDEYPALLPRAETDWYAVFVAASKDRNNKGDDSRTDRLKGLRNRERIWHDCEAILDQIDEYRSAGDIGDGVVVDARKTALEYMDLMARRNRAWSNYCLAGRPGEYRFKDWDNPPLVAAGH